MCGNAGGHAVELQSGYYLQATAKAVATAAYPLGERNALLMRSVKSAFALLLTKVTKPAAERRKESLKSGGNHYKKDTQRYVR